ncbi:hypothetical protein [Actinomadura sp. 7K507]|uniref:hypothetical protein n=1 Tax=Actinomadura sp. 7K507 TaxID=2530365 RepID=UPI0010497CE9|nr:hypothetical protein [Actinomadura sp. 7K507]TDC84396.1 hypothetical protein E1285_26935 [Actinomadura sp. 7K507]
MNWRVGIRPALRRLFAKFADRESGFFRLPFFFDFAKGAGVGLLLMAGMKRRPPGTFESGRKRAGEEWWAA